MTASDKGRSRLGRSAIYGFALTLATLVAGCDSQPIANLHMPVLSDSFVDTVTNDDPSIPKVTTDSTIPILLSSNKQMTEFVVNGKGFPNAKTLKVKVPHEAIKITAQAPCYRPLEQRANANDFGPMSQFEFTFSTWDKDPSAKGRRDCSS